MLPADVAAAHALSEIIHPGYPERPEVFAERLHLYPEGCLVLTSGEGAMKGYALTHPYVKDTAPPLDTLLGRLPDDCDIYYFHDIALLPEVRGGNAGKAVVTYLQTHASVAGFDTVCLVAVNASAPFWERLGFAAHPVESLRERLDGYGAGAAYMRAQIRLPA
jgi:GNAT superfamily N-acetyltransferase